jgi:hypothetical protein
VLRNLIVSVEIIPLQFLKFSFAARERQVDFKTTSTFIDIPSLISLSFIIIKRSAGVSTYAVTLFLLIFLCTLGTDIKSIYKPITESDKSSGQEQKPEHTNTNFGRKRTRASYMLTRRKLILN